MIRRFAPFVITTALLAVPALAQTPPTNAPESAPTIPMAPTIPVAPTTTIGGESAVAPVIDVDRIVVLEFPSYDRDGLPGLSSTEFGQWVGVLFTNARQPTPSAEYLTAAFAQSDVSKDGVVSTGEFAAFLKGG